MNAKSGARLIPMAVMGLLLLAGWAGLHQSLMEIHANWTTWYGHFAHGYLVLAVSLWLGFRAWRRRPLLVLRPSWPAFPVLIALMGVLLLSMRMQITTVNQSMVPMIIMAALAASFGLQLARLLFWPLAYLYFALPLWWVLNTPLQELTIKVAMLAVNVLRIPAHVQGSTFELPAGILTIASGCSGLNYLVTGLAIAFLQGLLYLATWPARIKLMAFTAALMLVMNWIRVITLIAVGYYTEMQHYLIRVDHLTFGWILFLLVLWPIYWFGFRLARMEKDQVAGSGLSSPPDISSSEPARVLAGGVIASFILILPAVIGLHWQ